MRVIIVVRLDGLLDDRRLGGVRLQCSATCKPLRRNADSTRGSLCLEEQTHRHVKTIPISSVKKPGIAAIRSLVLVITLVSSSGVVTRRRWRRVCAGGVEPAFSASFSASASLPSQSRQLSEQAPTNFRARPLARPSLSRSPIARPASSRVPARRPTMGARVGSVVDTPRQASRSPATSESSNVWSCTSTSPTSPPYRETVVVRKLRSPLGAGLAWNRAHVTSPRTSRRHSAQCGGSLNRQSSAGYRPRPDSWSTPREVPPSAPG